MEIDGQSIEELYTALQAQFKERKLEYDKNVKHYIQARKEFIAIKKDIDGILGSMQSKSLVIPHARLTYDYSNQDLGFIQKHLEYFLERNRFDAE